MFTDDASVLHLHNPVTETRKLQIVRRHHNAATRVRKGSEEFENRARILAIERTSRFVREQYLSIRSQRARYRHSLPLTPRQVSDPSFLKARQHKPWRTRAAPAS